MTQDWIRHIDRLITQRPATRKALEAFRDIALLMGGARPEARPIHVDHKVREIKVQEGFPLFARDELPLDLRAAGDLLKRILKEMSLRDREDASGLKRAWQEAESEGAWSERLLFVILKQDESGLAEMAKAVDLNPGVLTFLGKAALRPSLDQLREAAGPYLDKAGWDRGYCPLCGSLPDMACFERSGKRSLHCELCGEEWPYPRIKCPFCGTEDQEKLGYLEAEEEEGFRVYFCRECGRYIKTVDRKAFEEPAPLELEALATLHLDLIAREKGFA